MLVYCSCVQPLVNEQLYLVHCIKGLIGQSDNNREKNPNYFSFRRQEFFGVYNEMDNWKWFACLTLDKTTMTRRTHKNGNIWWSGIFMFYRRSHRTASSSNLHSHLQKSLNIRLPWFAKTNASKMRSFFSFLCLPCCMSPL